MGSFAYARGSSLESPDKSTTVALVPVIRSTVQLMFKVLMEINLSYIDRPPLVIILFGTHELMLP